MGVSVSLSARVVTGCLRNSMPKIRSCKVLDGCLPEVVVVGTQLTANLAAGRQVGVHVGIGETGADGVNHFPKVAAQLLGPRDNDVGG